MCGGAQLAKLDVGDLVEGRARQPISVYGLGKLIAETVLELVEAVAAARVDYKDIEPGLAPGRRVSCGVASTSLHSGKHESAPPTSKPRAGSHLQARRARCGG